MSETVDVVFVCLGNICRSPMAEALFCKAVQEKGLERRITVDSCGTGDWHVGQPPHEGTRRILREKGISDEGLQAAAMDPESIGDYDYIVAMDRSNVANLRRAGVPAERIRLLTDFIPDKQAIDVPDPFYTGGFEEVYALVEVGAQGLLRHLIGEQGWDGRNA